METISWQGFCWRNTQNLTARLVLVNICKVNFSFSWRVRRPDFGSVYFDGASLPSAPWTPQRGGAANIHAKTQREQRRKEEISTELCVLGPFASLLPLRLCVKALAQKLFPKKEDSARLLHRAVLYLRTCGQLGRREVE